MFRLWAFCHERDPGLADYPTLWRLHGKLSPRLIGIPHLADRATRLAESPHLSCKRDQDKIRNYMDRRVTPPGRVTSPTWGPPPPCKQALTHGLFTWLNDFTTTLCLTPTHNSRLIRRKHSQKRPVVSSWNSVICGAIKHVSHTCLFGYVWINEITHKCQST